MDGTVVRLAQGLQSLFGSIAESHNQQIGWIQRRRSLSAAGWVLLLVFGWVGHRWRHFAELAQLAGVTAQGLQQRLTDKAVQLFQAVCHEAMQQVFLSHRPLIPLLCRFRGIVIEDATQLPLPASLADRYPACGGLDGQRGRAGWKWLIRYDVLTGRLDPFTCLPGKTSERDADAQPAGAWQAGLLYLADLGYFAVARLRQILAAQAHYITRLPARVWVQGGGDDRGALVGLWLSRQVGPALDQSIRLGKTDGLTTRLVALRLPAAVAAERRRKLQAKDRQRGRTSSANQLALCDWWVAATDLPSTTFSVAQVQTLYRLRWQVELLFKHWKQAGGLGVIHGRTAASVQVEYLAKLLGVLVTHWQQLLGGGPLEGKNRMAMHRLVCAACGRIAAALRGPGALPVLIGILQELAVALTKLRRRSRRTKAPSSRQRVYGKRVTA